MTRNVNIGHLKRDLIRIAQHNRREITVYS